MTAAAASLHLQALASLRRALPTRPSLARLIDVHILEHAGRLLDGLPITEAALAALGRRYLELIVELAKQVDARESAERDMETALAALGAVSA